MSDATRDDSILGESPETTKEWLRMVTYDDLRSGMMMTFDPATLDPTLRLARVAGRAGTHVRYQWFDEEVVQESPEALDPEEIAEIQIEALDYFTDEDLAAMGVSRQEVLNRSQRLKRERALEAKERREQERVDARAWLGQRKWERKSW